MYKIVHMQKGYKVVLRIDGKLKSATEPLKYYGVEYKVGVPTVPKKTSKVPLFVCKTLEEAKYWKKFFNTIGELYIAIGGRYEIYEIDYIKSCPSKDISKKFKTFFDFYKDCDFADEIILNREVI